MARARYLRQSARKLNRMLHEVRGKDVNLALNILHFTPNKASVFIEKTLRSAIANIMNAPDAKEVDIDQLYIKQAFAAKWAFSVPSSVRRRTGKKPDPVRNRDSIERG